jgi:hypothetical protein
MEAAALASEGKLGPECAERVRQTRALYNDLLEELRTVGPSGSEFARGLEDSIGERLEHLERRTLPAVAEIRAGPALAISQPPSDQTELWHVWRMTS